MSQSGVAPPSCMGKTLDDSEQASKSIIKNGSQGDEMSAYRMFSIAGLDQLDCSLGS